MCQFSLTDKTINFKVRRRRTVRPVRSDDNFFVGKSTCQHDLFYFRVTWTIVNRYLLLSNTEKGKF
jgi:hypothetical protein